MEEETIATTIKRETREVVINGEKYSYEVDLADVSGSSEDRESMMKGIDEFQVELSRARTALNRSDKKLANALEENEKLKAELAEVGEDRHNARIILQYEKEEKERLQNQLYDVQRENVLLKEKLNALENQMGPQTRMISSVVPSTSAALNSTVANTGISQPKSRVPERRSKRVPKPCTSYAASEVVSPTITTRIRARNGLRSRTFSRDAAYAEKNKDKKNFACDLCAKAFMKLGLLKFHKKRTHKINDTKVEFGCVDCGSIFDGMKMLREHRRSAHSAGN